MIPTNIVQRTFHISISRSTGTCFTLDVEGKQYLVTAKHVVNDIENNDTIRLYHDNQWKNIEVSLVGHALGNLDISVLSTNIQLSPPFQLEPISKTGGIIYGQDVYFLGFPYGMASEVGELNRDFPLPFVKKAILSCIDVNENKEQVLFLDGHNNPGFSGGPVVFKPYNQSDYRVASIISGFRYQMERIYQGEQEVSLEYKYNTGIIVSYGINHALDLIKKNPNGFKLPK